MLAAILGGGAPLLLATAASLVLAGGFAMFLAASGEFLPHDIRYLGMSAADLCATADCRIVKFMVHDRAAFGGALFAVGVLYVYLVLFPLRQGQAWAWWLLATANGTGAPGLAECRSGRTFASKSRALPGCWSPQADRSAPRAAR